MNGRRAGLLCGAGAYGIWGVFPAFFPLLEPAGAPEILAHRIVWSLLTMLVVVAVVRRLGDLRRIDRRTWALLAAASALISVNWVVYIYAVNNGHVTDAALGYFINPLVTVALGLVFFGERLDRAQVAALAAACVGVVVLTVQGGAPPVIALALAVSFGLYGAVKKVVPTDPRVSVGVEAGLAAPIAVTYLVVAQLSGAGTFVDHGAGHTALLVVAGIGTAGPLLLFAAAAQRLPMVTLGLLQYLTPVLQLLFGVLVAHEPMPAARWVGFGFIWLALTIATVHGVRSARRGPATTEVRP